MLEFFFAAAIIIFFVLAFVLMFVVFLWLFAQVAISLRELWDEWRKYDG